ncbi:MAG TPA: hypothetical protein DDW52_13260 [Planctomycetaceae bacterium]|nr:hypothetical protein [Planctomycetaceae bacterium]
MKNRQQAWLRFLEQTSYDRRNVPVADRLAHYRKKRAIEQGIFDDEEIDWDLLKRWTEDS